MSASTRIVDLTGDGVRTSMRVALVTRFPPSFSGAAQGAAELTRTLMTPFGAEVDVIRLVPLGDVPSSGRPVVMEVNPSWRLSGRVAASRVNRCDVALVQYEPGLPGAMVEELISRARVPMALVLDDVPPSATGAAHEVAAMVARASAVVVRTETARRRLQEQTNDSVRLEVIPHGSPLTVLEPPSSPRSRVLSWGFLNPRMGVERVVGALARLRDLVPAPQYRVIAIADPGWSRAEAIRYRRDVQGLAEALGVGGRLRFDTVLHSSSELVEQTRDSDVIAVMYDTTERSASRILTEAVSTGRPVVATRFPGAVEMLGSGAGFTVDHDDHEGLATALRRLLSDDDAYREAAEAARAWGPLLSWESVAGRFLELFLQLTGSAEPKVAATP